MQSDVIHTRKYRERLLKDQHRPTYHFAISDDNGYPGDSNGAFYADGVYHLMYLYRNSETNAFQWGHISSLDLLHWRHHPDALTTFEGDEGCFSGGGFVDDDRTAYLTFWKFPSKDNNKDKGGIAIAYAKPPYDEWKRLEPIAVESSLIWGSTDITYNGENRHVCCADPSNIWKMNGRYYMQTGNKVVLDAYGRNDDSPEKYKGDWTDLFRSDDLEKWEYVGRFYDNPQKGVNDWPDETEDDMCPSFLPLYDAEENGIFTGKYLQLFISHNKGCQYYIGRLDKERFIPEQHGRMSWKDSAYFAPEGLVDGKNRQIIWAWLRDNLTDDFKRFGWSGVFGIPRNIWYADGKLNMAPVSELEALEYDHIAYDPADGKKVKVGDGSKCRIKGIWNGEGRSGVAVRVSKDGAEYTQIYYSQEERKLIMDTTMSGNEGWKVREEAPLELEDGEDLSLDILIDNSVIEVYANKRQAICRRVYPTDPKNSVGVKLIGSRPKRLDTYRMFPSNPY